MKKLYTLIIIIFFLFGFQTKVNACPFMGGEITWECISSGDTNNGKFIFTMKLYRECGQGQFGPSMTLMSNSPAGAISMQEISGWPKEISPICNSDTSFQHITCQGAIAYVFNGAIQEHIYKSQPIKINGYPPYNGWIFYWQNCCRNNSTNLYSGQSYRLMATMYPKLIPGAPNYGAQNTYPCFDSSPTFAETPVTAIATGYDYDFNFMAFDNDYDSLVYEWGRPLLYSGNYVNYNMGYTYTSPLPGTTQNSNNTPALLDSKTGIISFKSYTTGSFLTSVKVTAYRCGIKLAEVRREIQVALSDSVSNAPPVVNAPFANGTSFDTVVTAGTLLQFPFVANDFQFLPNSGAQTVFVMQNSPQFGDFIPAVGSGPTSLSSTSGCKYPPCATLTPAADTSYTPSAIFAIQSNFSWQTTCDHLLRNDTCMPQKDTVYYQFLFTVRDDYCPVPAVTTKIVRIGITADLSYLPPPIIDSVFYDYATNEANISWQMVNDPKNKFLAYYIYYSPTNNGNFTLIDSVLNINTTSYIHNLGQPANAYYKIRTKSENQCQMIDTSDYSNTVSMLITAIDNGESKPSFVLYPNEPNPADAYTNIRFSIAEPANVEFVLTDINGRIIDKRNIQAHSGENSFKLLLESFSAGIYYYSIIYKNQKKTNKLMVK